MDAPCVEPRRLCNQARRTAMATKGVRTETASLLPAIQWVGQLVHQPAIAINILQGCHHCHPL